MTPTFRRSLISVSIATIASVGLLAGCEQKTTTRTADGTTTSSTTTTTPSPEVRSTANEMKADAKSAGNEMKADAKSATDKAGTAIEDGAITAKVKTALLADPDVKGLAIDVDTHNGVVTLKGTADKPANKDRAVAIAKDTGGVKSVQDQLVVKASS
jgi:hyperosmotically inducible protein